MIPGEVDSTANGVLPLSLARVRALVQPVGPEMPTVECRRRLGGVINEYLRAA